MARMEFSIDRRSICKNIHPASSVCKIIISDVTKTKHARFEKRKELIHCRNYCGTISRLLNSSYPGAPSGDRAHDVPGNSRVGNTLSIPMNKDWFQVGRQLCQLAR